MKDTKMFEKGDKVFIRTIAFYYTGEIAIINEKEIWLEKCAWIPETGRFSKALSSGEFDEVEPYPSDLSVFVNPELITDMIEWKHSLPLEEK